MGSLTPEINTDPKVYSHTQSSYQPEITSSSKIQTGIITIVRVSLYSVFHDYV